MTHTNHIRRSRATSWLLAAAATFAFVIGMWPATLLASCIAQNEPSCCCCPAESDRQADAADTHRCAESGCECHVAPDNQPPAPLDAVVNAATGVMLAPDNPADEWVRSDVGGLDENTPSPRGDPIAPQTPIYLRNQVLLL